MAPQLLAQVGRIVALLSAITAIVFLAALIYVRSLMPLSWPDTVDVARIVLLITSMASAAVLIAIATVGSVISLVKMLREVAPGRKPLWLRLNMNNVVFAPQFLTAAGLEHRQRLKMYAALALVAFALAMLGLALEGLGDRAT